MTQTGYRLVGWYKKRRQLTTATLSDGFIFRTQADALEYGRKHMRSFRVDTIDTDHYNEPQEERA